MKSIYLDVLIVLNIYVNYFLLRATAKFTHTPLKTIRCIISSVIGSLFSLTILLPAGNFLIPLAIKLGAAVVIVGMAFGIKDKKHTLKLILYFYIVNFIFGGVVMLLYITFKPSFMAFNNSYFYVDFSLLSLVIFTAVAYFAVTAVRRLMDRGCDTSHHYKVIIRHKSGVFSMEALVRLGYLLFPVPEGGLCMVADVTEQGEQFAVQFPVADAQAVGVILHVAYPLRLQGDKLFVQRAELVGRGGHLHRFLAAEPSGYAFLLLHDGTGLCRLPCSFWQMVHQQAVGFVLPVEHLHDLVQVCLLVRQQLLQGIYLRQTEYVAMVRLQHLQQAVHPQPSRLVGMVVLILPSDDALAQ